MAGEDVITHGQLTEFRLKLRCEACQLGNRKCILQESDERCMLCTDADRHCNFVRTVVTSGPRSAFRWDQLLSQPPREIINSADFITTDKNPNTTAGVGNSQLVNTQLDEVDRGRSTASLSARQVMAEPPDHQRRCTSVRGRGQSARKWRKAVTLCNSIAAFKAAGKKQQHGKDKSIIPSCEASTFQMLSNIEKLMKERHEGPWVITSDNRQSPSSSPEKSGQNVLILDPHNKMALHEPRTRHLSPSGREHAKRMRKIGACSHCREKKKRCTHMQRSQ